MPRGELTHSNIERLLRREGSDISDADLRLFIASLSLPEEPPRDVATMATALAATARSARPDNRRHSFRRLAILASAGALVMALGSVALAADSSVPGDALYGLDRALEAIGVGDGGVDERIVEFEVLMANGQDDEAYSMLAEVIETEGDAASERAQHHLELAATKTNPSAESAQEKVAALQEFIAQNKGQGGLNGEDFGEGLAAIAKSEHAVPSDSQGEETGTADAVEPSEQPGNAGDAPGQQDDSPGPDQQPGNSANAPGQQDESPRGDPSQSGSDIGGQPGNSSNAPGQQRDGAGQSDQSESGEQSEERPGNSADAPGQQKDKKDGS